MKYSTIRIEGAILSSDVLDKIESGEISFQAPKDFGFDAKVKVKDEIAKSWADAQEMWRIFQRQSEKIQENASGVSETRKYWIVPLLGLLGYEADLTQRSEVVNNQNYFISHRATNLGGFPVHIMGFNDSLDKKRSEGGPRMSPHALVQEYLNLTEHIYAIVTNGYQFRLLRDASRLVKLSYLEFDLKAMMEEEHFADFAIFFRLLHASRMPARIDAGPESIIEQYHQDALDSGSRIRDGLSIAVGKSINALANGFLSHPANDEFRATVQSKQITPQQFYQCLLRLIYRLLFLMVIEERDLIFEKKADKRKRDIYYQFYSVSHLRELCERPSCLQDNCVDLWIALTHVFQLFESDEKGAKLGISPLAGDLFGYDAIGILNKCQLDNQIIIECLRNLSFFVNPNTNQKMRINYSALNTEEFGSVYEGLLEYEPQIIQSNGSLKFIFAKGSERAISGSHYTPDELVKPLIDHSLKYVIEEKLKEKDKEPALLSIRVCDVACGSGHILLNAARVIGSELGKVRSGEDQPSPPVLRQGIRDAIMHCIYGVDKNPLAVELCKVSLWLEAHNPGQPLNFLDHHVKCGDAIVGLATRNELERGIPEEAFNRMPEDDKTVASHLAKRNKEERKTRLSKQTTFSESLVQTVKHYAVQIGEFCKLPERNISEIENKRKKYLEISTSPDRWRLRNLADIQVAQFFISKVKENSEKIITDGEFFQHLKSGQTLQGPKVAKAMAVANEKQFFHWFLEFPEVFEKGGFDCILGNPPFLGGQKLTGTYGDNYCEYIRSQYAPIGSVDLVTYFFRRIFNLIRATGFQSLIATNTIAQGSAREGGLAVIIQQGGTINHAVRSMKWPGRAAVQVSLVTVYNGVWKKKIVLDKKEVPQITSYLDDSESLPDPFKLDQNSDKSFQGSIVLGSGFVLDPDEAKRLISKNPKNKDVLFPYLNGEDLNSRPDQSPSRWVINFFDWALDQEWDSNQKVSKGPPYAADYPDCLAIVERDVKPERTRWEKDKNGNDIVGQYALRKPLPEKWWIYGEKRPALYSIVKQLHHVFVVPRISKYLTVNLSQGSVVFSDATVVFAFEDYALFSMLQSNIHEEWVRRHSSSLESRLRYAPSDCFETFPFPNIAHAAENELSRIGKSCCEHRQRLMIKLRLGLTKLYNLFHEVNLSSQCIADVCGQSADVSESGLKDLIELRKLHCGMDQAVLNAYGWQEVSLAHDFYEVDYLPENDRIRYTISPEARKEILKRLLKLNHEIYAVEEATRQTQIRKPSKKSKKEIVSSPQTELF